MKLLTCFFAGVAVAGSVAAHWYLFGPFDLALPWVLARVQVVQEEKTDEPKTESLPAVEIDEPPAESPREPEPTVASAPSPAPATSAPITIAGAPSESGPNAAGGEPRSDLVLDYRVEDEATVLAFANAIGLHFVLLDPLRGRSWPIAIDLRDGARLPASPPSKVDRYLELPDRSRTRRLRYADWCAQARGQHGLPPNVRVTLALAIPGNLLDDAGRTAVSAACAARGLAATEVSRAVLRPVVDGAGSRLEVEELALGRAGQ